jgi:uncharacterized protein
MNNALQREVAGTTVHVVGRDYWMARLPPNAEAPPCFFTSADAHERTVLDRTWVRDLPDVLSSEGPFALLQFRLASPFGEPGFIGHIGQALGDANISVLVVSTFTYDYALVPDADVENADRALQAAGFPSLVDDRPRGPREMD